MPWRGHPDPYAVWISEIMLQQTQVVTAGPYFERFVARFPSIAALAAAPAEAVLKLWEGLGYYARARNLQRAARRILADHGGQLPHTAAELGTLPGIGPYTAAAIASICFGECIPVVDGNVARVFARHLGWTDDFRKLPARRKLAECLSAAFVDCRAPGDLNQAMMELGALICTPTQPNCPHCPLATHCVARRTGRQTELPLRPRKAPVPERQAFAAVIRRGDAVLMARRASEGLMGGLWELPGGFLTPGDPLSEAVARDLLARTGLTVQVSQTLGLVQHTFSHFRLRLHVLRCTCRSRCHSTLGDSELRWVTPAELAALPCATAQRKALALCRHP